MSTVWHIVARWYQARSRRARRRYLKLNDKAEKFFRRRDAS